MSANQTVQGRCEPRFAAVREEFERNFAERGDTGGSVAVFVDGEPVVDLWGGVKDETGAPWEEDTLSVIFSCSKGLASMCMNMLIDRGVVDPELPVAHYWPEFAQNGKEGVTIRMSMNHTSGVFHVDDTIPVGGFNDWDTMVKLVEETAPAWDPGTSAGYHGLVIGWTLGEVLRRVDGRTIGTFFREEIAEPLGGVDAWIGLPAEHEDRVAKTITYDPSDLPPEFASALQMPLGVHLSTNLGEWVPDRCDTRETHAAENPGGGAIANARALAHAYAPFSVGGTLNGVRLVSPRTIDAMRYTQTSVEKDLVLGIRTAFSRGFSKSWENYGPGAGLIMGEDAFGAAGLGGQLGFADPTYRVSFGYTTVKHGLGTALNERGQSLVDATYRALGSANKDNGFWVNP